jgi:leucyl-tRNA synthetase
MKYEFSRIEKKWQKIWEERKAYQALQGALGRNSMP